MRSPFVTGQRWASETEPELGLGSVSETDGRRVSIFFQGSQCTRIYAAAAAPLQRIIFKEGEMITTCDGEKFSVTSVFETKGLITYGIKGGTISETHLSHTLSAPGPLAQLKNGRYDTPGRFDLRAQALTLRMASMASPVRGFLGGRVDTISHQLHIAQEVSSRHMPRVLLADEVGLGKTIEACLILHRLILTERISRVLILVPDALVHQWFVELLRRFNLHFRIADEAHLNEMEQGSQETNPFEEDQLFISGISGFQRKKRQIQALEAHFDMVVVDESHHIHPTHELFSFLEKLGQKAKGLLLLSATPEQLGEETHFSLLRLLDPMRYPNLDTFQKAQKNHAEVAGLANKLLKNVALNRQEEKKIKSLLPPHAEANREAAINALVDCHGPGRVIFRNTRKQITGFPKRRLLAHSLDTSTSQTLQMEKQPEILWLASFLKETPDEKALLICQSKKTAQKIAETLSTHLTVKTALFHEGLTLLQRDRNAAWFAEKNGARLLISSEIGSEGRNFQFARHLILFDLPSNPEKLEQRIGRLDRIGQQHDILIHVPFVKESASELLLRWYEATGIFSGSVPCLHQLGEAFGKKTNELANQPFRKGAFPQKKLDTLIKETSQLRVSLESEFEKGRDRLLEMSAHRPEKVKKLIAQIKKEGKNEALEPLMIDILEAHGVEVDEAMPNILKLTFTENTALALPPLKRNPVFVTFHRPTALKREDLEFLTTDHPLVSGALESLMGSETGRSSFGILHESPEAGLRMEALFVPECVAPAHLGVQRFLPKAPIATIVDHEGDPAQKNWSKSEIAPLSPAILEANPTLSQEILPSMEKMCHHLTEKKRQQISQEALSAMKRFYDAEIDRARYLMEKNPSVSKDELHGLIQEKKALSKALGTLRLRLDALQVLIMQP